MSWSMVKLGEAPLKISDGNYSAKYPKANEFLDSGIPFLSGFNIVDGEINEYGCKYISTELHSELKKGHIKTGDVLITTRGNIGSTAIVPARLDDANINAQLVLLRPDTKHIDSSYLKHIFNSPNIKRQIDAGLTGSALKQLPIRSLKEIEIPLPPLAEQKRIAAILDKADAIRRKRQQAIQLADDFLRAVFLEMFGDPLSNPKGWEVRLLKDIAKIQIGPFGTQLHKEDYVSDGIPLINPSHIKNSEVVPDFNLTVSEQKFAELSEYHLNVGDIIMGRRGEMGRCALIGERETGWLCGTGSLYIRPFLNNAQSFYLFKYLSSDYIKTYLEGESLGATMPNLNKTIVGNIKIPMPSAEAITKFQKILAADNAYREKVTLIDDSLFESLSQKAFSGQL